jgi:hypothetical protein
MLVSITYGPIPQGLLDRVRRLACRVAPRTQSSDPCGG